MSHSAKNLLFGTPRVYFDVYVYLNSTFEDKVFTHC